MNGIPPIGKVNRKFLEDIIFSKLQIFNPEILVHPKHGIDTGAIQISKERVMVFSTDPLSIIPNIKLEDSGWFSAHMLVNDFVTCGFPPEYATLNFNLPPKITDEEFKIFWDSLIKEFNKIGISVISGHTGRYEGCNYSIVGAGTIMGIGKKNQYINSSMARIGDSVIITKGIAIEATSILAKAFPTTISEKIGKSLVKKAQKTFQECSVVKDALIASSIGDKNNGVTAMHDATEGGLFGCLADISSASSKGLVIKKKDVFLSEEAEAICSLFGLNPYTTLSSGTMIMTVRPEKEIEIMDTLKTNGIKSSKIGKIIPVEDGCYYEEKGKKKNLSIQDEDLYWKIFWEANQNKWI